MLCSECKLDLGTFKKYILHLELIHKIKTNYQCPIENCQRTYCTKYSLKDHLTFFHKLFDNRRLDSKPIEKTSHPNSPMCTNISINKTITHDPIELNSSTKLKSNSENCSQDSENVTMQFKKDLHLSVILLISKLYSNLNMPRNQIQNIIDIFKSFLTDSVSYIESQIPVLGNINSNNISNDILPMKNLSLCLDIFKNCFQAIDTEHRLINLFNASGKLVKPIKKKIGVSKAPKRVDSKVIMTLKDEYVHLVPLRNSLKLFLELPQVLQTILDYQRYLSSTENVLLNVVNGVLWKLKAEHEHCSDISIPIYIYYDDFENGNPLGSHAGKHKIGAVYCSIATIPPQFASRLENIFLALLFYSNQRVNFGNKAVFQPLLDELNFLENCGIDILSNNEKLKVKFYLIALSGDNLGLNSIMGYMESFSASNYCRICTMNKQECQTAISESEEKIRSRANYNHCLANNIGVKELCVWNSLDSFHACENTSVDVMHDLCEGVHRYSMASIIQSFINKKVFTLDQLNSRTKYFTYTRSEHNHPPPVTKQHLCNGIIMFSASEMLCFVRNFRYFVGDFVDERDEVWNYYLLLLELTETLTEQTISTEHLVNLKHLIKEHHKMYIELFKSSLKPKYHFLVHYPGVINKLGPPIFYSAFKFEAKHKELKRVSRSIASRTDLCYSISIRCQLKDCSRFLTNGGFENKTKCGKLKQCVNIPCHLNGDNYFTTVTFENNGYIYDHMSVVLYECKDDNPIFLLINDILIRDKDFKSVILACSVLQIINYSTHLKAYQVNKTNEYKYISLIECFDQMPIPLRSVGGNLYVSFYK
ncbi:uncharacterized protein LOC125236159 isoform X1 [Leguminivora glycinivorella]|uniref:uncharacterized protein LOC125236159 isoform X1 n=1 Tax=Leguminivora glycinivorella TaxID=1035111 RepID=UPI00200C56A6|nr:uncharacterized protein LOC125236159 isoform X1 [Leguminivora glycinivorella]